MAESASIIDISSDSRAPLPSVPPATVPAPVTPKTAEHRPDDTRHIVATRLTYGVLVMGALVILAIALVPPDRAPLIKEFGQVIISGLIGAFSAVLGHFFSARR